MSGQAGVVVLGRGTDAPVFNGRMHPVIVLDAGGVVVSRAMDRLLVTIAGECGRAIEEVGATYRSHLRHALWAGHLTVDEFWPRLACLTGGDEADGRRWQASMDEHLIVLPGRVERLMEWATVCRLALFSNHRAEWLTPVLVEAGLYDAFSHVWISSHIGMVKPDLAAFQWVRTQLGDEPVCYVDDQQRNLQCAKAVGMQTVLAQAEDEWLRWGADVDRWLSVLRERSGYRPGCP